MFQKERLTGGGNKLIQRRFVPVIIHSQKINHDYEKYFLLKKMSTCQRKNFRYSVNAVYHYSECVHITILKQLNNLQFFHSSLQ